MKKLLLVPDPDVNSLFYDANVISRVEREILNPETSVIVLPPGMTPIFVDVCDGEISLAADPLL